MATDIALRHNTYIAHIASQFAQTRFSPEILREIPLLGYGFSYRDKVQILKWPKKS